MSTPGFIGQSRDETGVYFPLATGVVISQMPPERNLNLAARPEDWLPPSEDGRGELKVETQPRLNRRGLFHQPQNYFWKTAVRWGKLFAAILWT